MEAIVYDANQLINHLKTDKTILIVFMTKILLNTRLFNNVDVNYKVMLKF